MSRLRLAALDARLEVQALALREMAKLLPAEQAATFAAALGEAASALAERDRLDDEVDAAISGEVGRLLHALRRPVPN